LNADESDNSKCSLEVQSDQILTNFRQITDLKLAKCLRHSGVILINADLSLTLVKLSLGRKALCLVAEKVFGSFPEYPVARDISKISE
jgi:hypothetical protein